MSTRARRVWFIWSVLALGLIGYMTMRFFSDDRTAFVPGETTAGHYQIEMKCAVCHTPGMGVKQESCITCHGQELELADDSHPPAKFLDPRNADRVAKLDARFCITCHVEHRPTMTRAMGVTMPMDYCANCHQDIAEERPSHKGMGFETCASAGCHNFHDNRAIHEDFLTQHVNDPDTLTAARLPAPNTLDQWLRAKDLESATALTAEQQDAPPAHGGNEALVNDWLTTAHARAGVNCKACHEVAAENQSAAQWVDKPDHRVCQTCHAEEAKGFLGGRHGMRLAQDLSPMTPAMARLPMKASAAHRELTCTSCHGAHRFDVQFAAAAACVQCHNDPHTKAYLGSPHEVLWKREVSGKAAAGTGVSCATCHLPRQTHREGGRDNVRVNHNQNDNLHPNEKMIGNVCVRCHGVEFAIDALADTELIKRNFAGQPAAHIQSMDMVRAKLQKLLNERKSAN